jgi:hypothetical protein
MEQLPEYSARRGVDIKATKSASSPHASVVHSDVSALVGEQRRGCGHHDRRRVQCQSYFYGVSPMTMHHSVRADNRMADMIIGRYSGIARYDLGYSPQCLAQAHLGTDQNLYQYGCFDTSPSSLRRSTKQRDGESSPSRRTRDMMRRLMQRQVASDAVAHYLYAARRNSIVERPDLLRPRFDLPPEPVISKLETIFCISSA